MSAFDTNTTFLQRHDLNLQCPISTNSFFHVNLVAALLRRLNTATWYVIGLNCSSTNRWLQGNIGYLFQVILKTSNVVQVEVSALCRTLSSELPGWLDLASRCQCRFAGCSRGQFDLTTPHANNKALVFARKGIA